MKTIDIKGKPYITVNERLKEFRNSFPEYSIETEIIKITESQIIMKAVIKNPNEFIVSTGHAEEKQDGGYIQKTSFVEVCETSAIGRALGIFGIGIDTSICSADEMKNIGDQKPQILPATNKPKSVYNKPETKKPAPNKEPVNQTVNKLAEIETFINMKKITTQKILELSFAIMPAPHPKEIKGFATYSAYYKNLAFQHQKNIYSSIVDTINDEEAK